MAENHHLVILSQMCRVCGYVNPDISCRRPVKETKTFAQDLLRFSIDVTKDDANVHPKSICKSCDAIAKMSPIDDENTNKLTFYDFQPHSPLNLCHICMHPCPACLLVPTKSLPTEGYLRKPLTNKKANSIRHKALLKSSSHVCERNKHTPLAFSQKCLCLDALVKYPEHADNCKLCTSACHLCGEYLSPKTSRFFSIQYVETPVDEPVIGKWAMKRKMAESGGMWCRNIETQSNKLTKICPQTAAPSSIIAEVLALNRQVLTSVMSQPNKNTADNAASSIQISTCSVATPSTSNPVFSSPADISNDLMPVEFGCAPPNVAKRFLEKLSMHGSLTQCLDDLLKKAATLFFKYKFIESQTKCVLLGVPTKKDNTQELQNQLNKLDEYITNSNLTSRAAALEELMFSTDQNESHVNAILQEVKALRPETVSLGIQSDLAEQSHVEDNIIFLGNREDFVHYLYQSFKPTYDAISKDQVWKCYLCQEKFSNKKQILENCWKHCQYFDYTCAYCKFQFQSPCDMYQHVLMQVCVKEKSNASPTLKTVEGSELQPLPNKYTGIVPQHYRPFTVSKSAFGSVIASCMLCKFTSSVNEISYHARQHVGDFPYRCSQCKFLSVCPSQLFKHQKITGHTGYTLIRREKPLSGQEKQEVMANLHHKLEGIFLKGYIDTQQDVEKFQDIHDIDPEAFQGDIKSTTWMFCQNCNSAFYDDCAYQTHIKSCGMSIEMNIDKQDDTSSNDKKHLLVKTEFTDGAWENSVS